jgi:pimeloyl-ACP methyl ester carboxylesterase
LATFALVHGAWHNAWCWELVAPALEAHGHRVIAPDLPCDDLGATFETYADVVVDALDGTEAPIVVGHSLGGMTIPLVAERIAGARLVYVCAYLRLPGEHDAPRQFNEGFGADLRDELGRTAWSHDRALGQLYERVPRDLAEAACARLRPQSQSPFASPYPLTRLPARPAAWILALEDEFFRTEWSRWAARELVGIEPVELPGGHFPMLERPSELVELLLEQAT